MHSLQERKFLVCCCVKRKVNDYVPLPGMPRHSWTDEEAQTFLLGLYIFGKNLVQVAKFVGSKTMGEVLSYYYGDFFHSDAYRRWAACRKARSRRCILGLRIFSGSRQQELLSRLLGGVAREVEDPLQEVFRKFNEGTYTFEQFILTLKSTIGAPERSSGPAVRMTRSSSLGRGKPSSGQTLEKKTAPGRIGRNRGATKKTVPTKRKRSAQIITSSDEEKQGDDGPSGDTAIPVAVPPPDKGNSPVPRTAEEAGGSSGVAGGEHSSTEPIMRVALAPVPAVRGEVDDQPPQKKKEEIPLAPLSPLEEMTMVEERQLDPPSAIPIQPTAADDLADIPRRPGPPTWLSQISFCLSTASSWYTEASAYMDQLSEENQTLRTTLEANQTAVSEASSMRSSLEAAEKQIAFLTKENEEKVRTTIENAELRTANEELLRVQKSLEDEKASLLAKLDLVKKNHAQNIYETSAAVLGLAKSHYPMIEGTTVSEGFNCRTEEEALELIEAMKPPCIVITKKMGLDVLFSDEEENNNDDV